MSKQIENLDELIDYLTRLASAYRKSYKFCGRVSVGLQITAGILGCSTALALIPAIPIFVALVGALPSVVTILANKLKVADKKTILKLHYQKVKQLITEARIGKVTSTSYDGQKVIEDIFTKLLEIEKDTNYTTPLEIYMKEYKLNGYKETS